MSVNKVVLLGNVGKDPEIKTMSNGNEVANFSLATTDTWKDKQTGERKDRTEWHKIVIFNSGLIGIVKSYVHKGSKLYIEGSLQTREWTDKENKKNYVTEIILQGYGCSLQMLDGKEAGGDTQKYDQKIQDFSDRNKGNIISTAGHVKQEEPDMQIIDDDIPF